MRGSLRQGALAPGPGKFLCCRGSGRWGLQRGACMCYSRTWLGSLLCRGLTPRGCMRTRGTRQWCGYSCTRGHRALGGSHSVRCCVGHRRCSGVDGHRGDLGSLLDQESGRAESTAELSLASKKRDLLLAARRCQEGGRWRGTFSVLGASTLIGCCFGAQYGPMRSFFLTHTVT